MTDSSALTSLLLLLVLAVGLAAGALIGWLSARSRAEAQVTATADRLAAAESDFARERAALREELADVSGQLRVSQQGAHQTKEELEWQRRQNGELEKKMAPMREAFDSLRDKVDKAEARRIRSEAELGAKVAQMSKDFGEATRNVRDEARKLSTVLSRTEKRGAWGEMQLRGVVEASGMLQHVHFVEQDHSATDAGVRRPDMIIDLAGGRKVIVDSKVPLDAFLRLDGDEDPVEVLAEHGRLVHQHIQSLSAKEYWRRYDSPEFVIMFLPSEGLLSAALEARPALIQEGVDKKVFLATPTTLLAMLHTITHSWRQVEAAAQAREIQQAGAELYQRLLTMADRLDGVGRAIGKSVTEYNKLVGTIETRVIPAGRRMENLSVADTPLPQHDEVADSPRALKAGLWPDEAALASDTELVDPQTDNPAAHSDSSAA